MEKLTCPECGETVLPEAKVCENCGCKITVCPNCCMVYRENTVRCSACGRVLSEEAFHEKAKQDAKKIEERLAADNRRIKLFSKIELALKIIGFLLIGVSVAVYFLWKSQDELECLVTLQSYMDLCKALLGLGIIFLIIGGEFWEIFGELIGSISLCKWIQDIKFDYREYIRVHSKNEFETDESKVYTDNLAKAALLLENKKDKLFFNLYYIAKIFIGIAMIISVICYMSDYITQFFALRFATIEFEWLNAAFYPTIIFVICYLVLVFISVPHKHIKNKKEEILRSAKK